MRSAKRQFTRSNDASAAITNAGERNRKPTTSAAWKSSAAKCSALPSLIVSKTCLREAGSAMQLAFPGLPEPIGPPTKRCGNALERKTLGRFSRDRSRSNGFAEYAGL